MSAIAHVDRLALSGRVEDRLRRGELTSGQVEDFADFLEEVDRDLLHHRIILDNAYTRWFRGGAATDSELRHFVRQFSVFSNQFLVAALLRVINAPSLAQARAAKEILMNELGVIYRKPGRDDRPSGALDDEAKDREGDPELVSIEGTVDGGTFRFRAAHFEWLLAVGQGLGLGFHDMGQRRHGRATTLRFCDELEDGLMLIKQARHPQLRLAFFTWHNRVEAQHAGHVMEELEGVFFDPAFSRDRFFRGGREVLDAIALFWDGLEADRLAGIGF
jgi:hypothetical protein